jgi:hypothetical protein
MRKITSVYQDPLEIIWTTTAAKLGMQVIRDPDVFASWDGKGTLRIGEADSLDPDDSLAQMIFHEICHASVEGPAGFAQPDWGLDISDPSQLVHERACLRLQAALANKFGLREFLGATTDSRIYYDRLPEDPLQGTEPAAVLAASGWDRITSGKWAGKWDKVLIEALESTAIIAKVIQPFASSKSLWLKYQRQA